MYLTKVPFMDEKTQMSFQEFYEQVTIGDKIDTRPKDEIIERARAFEKRAKG